VRGGGLRNDGGGPSFGDQHPRIKLTINPGMQAAFDAKAPEAVKFQNTVDRAIGGGDVYLFAAWNAALMGQLTGDAKYCNGRGPHRSDKLVSSEQVLIDGGQNPMIASDDYYSVGDNIGDLALTYDWCYASDRFQGRRQSVARVRAASRVQTCGTRYRDVGRQEGAVDRLGDRRSGEQLLLQLPARDRCCSASRRTASNDGVDQWINFFHDTKVMNEMDPHFDMSVVGGGSREGTGYGTSLRGLWELYDIWQASNGREPRDQEPAHARVAVCSSSTRWCRRSIGSHRPADHRATRRPRSSLPPAISCKSLITLFPDDPLAPRAKGDARGVVAARGWASRSCTSTT